MTTIQSGYNAGTRPSSGSAVLDYLNNASDNVVNTLTSPFVALNNDLNQLGTAIGEDAYNLDNAINTGADNVLEGLDDLSYNKDGTLNPVKAFFNPFTNPLKLIYGGDPIKREQRLLRPQANQNSSYLSPSPNLANEKLPDNTNYSYLLDKRQSKQM